MTPDNNKQESASIFFATMTGMMVIGNLYAGKIARDAFFLANFDVTDLPKMMIATAILSTVAVLSFSRVLTRLGPAVLIPPLYIVSGSLFVLQWILMARMPGIVTVFLYLQASVLTALLISGFWSIANERWDPYTGKRVMARMVALNTIGGLLCAAAANGINQWIDSRAILMFLGALHVGCGLGLMQVVRGRREEMGRLKESPKGGLLSVLKNNRTIQRMATMMLVFASMVALVDYLFKAVLQESVSAEQLVTFFSYFYMIIGICSTVLQSTLGNKALTWLGVGGSMAILPFALIGGALVTFVVKSLMTATLLRGATALLTQSFFRAGFEPLFTPIPKADKRASKTVIDVGADRMGDLVGSLIILSLLALPGPTTDYLLFTIIILCMLMAMLIFALHRGYVSQLASNLLSGTEEEEEEKPIFSPDWTHHSYAPLERNSLLEAIEQYRASADTETAGKAAPDVAASPRVRVSSTPQSMQAIELEMIGDLTSGDPDRMRQALATRKASAATLPYILPLLADSRVLQEALNATSGLASSTSGQLVDALLEHKQAPLVRRRIPLLLAQTDNPVAILGLTLGLNDQELDVRFRCAEALATIRSNHPHLQVNEKEIERTIYKEIARLSESGYKEQHGVQPLKHLFNLFAITMGQEVMDICYDALDSADANLRGTALEFLENGLPADVRQTLWPLIAPSRTLKESRRSSEEIMRDLRKAFGRQQKADKKRGAGG